jgi:hypothetical protein
MPYCACTTWITRPAGDISTTLKYSVHSLGPTISFSHKEVSARSSRVAGTTALLLHVHMLMDSDTRSDDNSLLLGRWGSNEMLQYLMVQGVLGRRAVLIISAKYPQLGVLQRSLQFPKKFHLRRIKPITKKKIQPSKKKIQLTKKGILIRSRSKF